MQHREHLDEGTIHAWLDGALGAGEAAAVEAHVATCEACAAAVAEARGLIAASSRILAKLDVVPAGVVPRVAAPPSATSAADVTPITAARRPERRSWGPWWSSPSLRAAAVLLFVASGTLVVIREQEKSGERAVSDTTAVTLTSGRKGSTADGPIPGSASVTEPTTATAPSAAPMSPPTELSAPVAPPSVSPRPADSRDASANASRREADQYFQAAPPAAAAPARDFAGRGVAAGAARVAPSGDRSTEGVRARSSVGTAIPAAPPAVPSAAPPPPLSVSSARPAEERASSAARKSAARADDGSLRAGAVQQSAPTAPTAAVSPLRDESRSLAATGPVVTGVVRDASSGAPLEGASVLLRTPKENVARSGTVTDSAGRFSIATTAPGQYVVQARRIGYLSATDTVVTDDDERREVKADLALPLANLRLSEVVVTGVEKGATSSLVARASGCYALRLDEPREARGDEPSRSTPRAAPRPSSVVGGAPSAAVALPPRIVLETTRSRAEPLGYADSAFVARTLDAERQPTVADAGRGGTAFWTPVPPDSVHIVLSDGAAGLELRARVERSGLRGTVTPFTERDEPARSERPAEFRARKVACR